MDRRANNKELRDSLEVLVKKIFDSYNLSLSQSPKSSDSIPIFMVFRTAEDGIKKTDEYKKCLEIAKTDVHISSLAGKQAGTSMGMFTVDIDNCIMQFLYQLYLKTRTFDLDLFNERYEAF